MAAPIPDSIGASGRCYQFCELLREREHSRVWTAMSGQQKFVMKYVHEQTHIRFTQKVWPRLSAAKTTALRLPIDAIPDQGIFVYRHMRDNFLDLVKNSASLKVSRQILRRVLRGIAELHHQDIVHLDIKPDNIMVDLRHACESIVVVDVKIIDLEDAMYLPLTKCMYGALVGNENWRSPEAHFEGELQRPTDIFSFGLVCIYAVLGKVILGADEDFAKHLLHTFPELIRLQRLVSYFGDVDGVKGLMTHIDKEEIKTETLQTLWYDRHEKYIPYRSFSQWPEVQDESFKDLIKGLMNLDPLKRLTARQALEHPWFVSSL